MPIYCLASLKAATQLSSYLISLLAAACIVQRDNVHDGDQQIPVSFNTRQRSTGGKELVNPSFVGCFFVALFKLPSPYCPVIPNKPSDEIGGQTGTESFHKTPLPTFHHPAYSLHLFSRCQALIHIRQHLKYLLMSTFLCEDSRNWLNQREYHKT